MEELKRINLENGFCNISKHIQNSFRDLKKTNISKDEISKMQDVNFAKSEFGFETPILKKCDVSKMFSEQIKENGSNCYYADPIILNNQLFFLCNAWEESHLNTFNNWYNELNFKV